MLHFTQLKLMVGCGSSWGLYTPCFMCQVELGGGVKAAGCTAQFVQS